MSGVVQRVTAGPVVLGTLLPWPVVWRHPPDFQGSQIRRRTSESIGHIVQNHATVHSRGTRLEPEIEILRAVKPLNGLEILRIQLGNVYEHMVVHIDTMLILMSGAAVFGECRKLPNFDRAVRGSPAAASKQAGIIRCGVRGRRIPLERVGWSGINSKSV